MREKKSERKKMHSLIACSFPKCLWLSSLRSNLNRKCQELSYSPTRAVQKKGPGEEVRTEARNSSVGHCHPNWTWTSVDLHYSSQRIKYYIYQNVDFCLPCFFYCSFSLFRGRGINRNRDDRSTVTGIWNVETWTITGWLQSDQDFDHSIRFQCAGIERSISNTVPALVHHSTFIPTQNTHTPAYTD